MRDEPDFRPTTAIFLGIPVVKSNRSLLLEDDSSIIYVQSKPPASDLHENMKSSPKVQSDAEKGEEVTVVSSSGSKPKDSWPDFSASSNSAEKELISIQESFKNLSIDDSTDESAVG